MQALFQNSRVCIFKDVKQSIKTARECVQLFSFSIAEMKPQQQHHICMCILHITCAGNMRCAAAAA